MPTPHEIYRQAVAKTGSWMAGIRAVRQQCGMDLIQAKEVMVQAEGLAPTLAEYQQKLFDEIEKGVAEADRGEFAPDEEAKAFFEHWRHQKD